jgi:AbrB family looped-hinge helix DNA binding protein
VIEDQMPEAEFFIESGNCCMVFLCCWSLFPYLDRKSGLVYYILTKSYKEMFMPATVLSSKGQVIIPKLIRTAHQWESGQKFEAIDTGDGVLLKPAGPFSKTEIDDVAGCLHYDGPAKSIAEMDEAIARGVKESARDRR